MRAGTVNSYSRVDPARKVAPAPRGLKDRHLQLLAIGGAIGSGFFLGSGTGISQGGPSLLLAFLITGVVLYLLMRALGELTLAHPSAGSFTAHASQFIGPLAGFITGWSYWIAAVIGIIAEVSAIGLLLQHWFPGLPQWIPALCAVLLLYSINMATVRSFGELEYWLSIAKVATILAVMLFGMAILFFKFGDAGQHAAVSNLWTHGGFAPNGLAGFLGAFSVVITSYAGIEVIGLAAAETEHPQRTLPRAINGIFFRILLFYVGSFAILMMLYPWTLFRPQESPFVFVLARAGLPAAAGAVSVLSNTALFYSSNTAVFGSGRLLSALASAGQAPAFLRPLNKRRVPSRAITVCGVILLVGVFLNYLIPDRIFLYALTMIAWLILCVWSTIALSHLFYRRTISAEDLQSVHFRLPGSPYTNWLILFVMGTGAVMLALNGGSRATFYLLLSWFALLVAAYYGTRQNHL